MGILVIVDYVWNKISNSRDKNLSTWFYVDEFHLLLNDPLTAAYSTKMWKELRKWGGKPTGITQNVTDVLLSHQVENILKNSAFIVLLGQAAGDREILAERLGISPQQMEYITDTGVGEVLFITLTNISTERLFRLKMNFLKTASYTSLCQQVMTMINSGVFKFAIGEFSKEVISWQ